MTKAAGLVVALAGALGPAALSAQSPAGIVVESPAMAAGQQMPRDHTPDGRNESPPLVWRGLPAGARQLVVLCEDHGAGNPPPWVHWIIYNVPATASGLPQGIPFDGTDPMPPGLERARQGNNGWGLPMYRGPAPPVGTVHEYDFTVLAIDTELSLPAGLSRTEVLEAIEGHVIGRGSLVSTYTRVPAGAAP